MTSNVRIGRAPTYPIGHLKVKVLLLWLQNLGKTMFLPVSPITAHLQYYIHILNVSQLDKRSKTWLCKKFHNSIYYNTTTLPAMSLYSLYANLLFSLLAPLYSMFWPQQYYIVLVLHITVYTAVLFNSLPSLLNIKTDSSGLISTTLHSR